MHGFPLGSNEVHVRSEREKAGNYRERTYLYLAEFLKNNLTNFAVICLKKPQKAVFLGPICSKITVAMEKERRKRKKKEEERRKREKSNGWTFSFYNGYFGRKTKKCWTEKVHLAVTLFMPILGSSH